MTAQAIPSLEGIKASSGGFTEGGGYATPLKSTILSTLRVAFLFTYPATSWHPSKEGTLRQPNSQFSI